MDRPSTLTVEQEFAVQKFRSILHQASEQQAKEMAVAVYRQMLEKDNTYKELLRQNWGL